MTMQHFLFSPIDSWFFRESRSMDGSGATALESIFPPANNTLLGALRTHIGNQYHAQHNTSWQDFKNQPELLLSLQKIIGFGNDYASLQAQGAWLYHSKTQQLYFPCPLNLLKEGDKQLSLFKLGKACRCDLGERVRLPELDYGKAQSPIESAYLDRAAYNQLLSGKTVDYNALCEQKNIFSHEPRLGIERDNQRHKTVDGKLYQTKHLRLKEDWQLYLGLDGIPENFRLPETLLRLGGEARMTALQTLDNAPALPQKPTATADTTYLMLYLLTPLPDFARENNQPVLPNTGFTFQSQNDLTTWQGQLNGMDINIISAITGKPERIGGWDMVNHQSLPVRSFIPAGSCWYLKTDNAQDIIDALHGKLITTGNDRALGYGQVAVGLAAYIE